MAYIIVVEDDELVLAVCKRNLQVLGHEVLGMVDGLDLADEINKHTPDLIILDINLPFKNGFELMAEVKETHPQVTIIGVSSTPLSNLSNADAYKHLMDDFLAKPFTTNEFSEKINKLVK